MCLVKLEISDKFSYVNDLPDVELKVTNKTAIQTYT